jgi:hypothetical protein
MNYSGGTDTARSAVSTANCRPGTAESVNTTTEQVYHNFGEDLIRLKATLIHSRMKQGYIGETLDGKDDRPGKGKRHGVGTFYYGNGDIYDGVWTNDKRGNGQGRYFYASGDLFVGVWKDDMMHGKKQKFIYTNGSEYTGTMVSGKKLGKCVYKYSDGRIEKGEWLLSGRYVPYYSDGYFGCCKWGILFSGKTYSRFIWTCLADCLFPKHGVPYFTFYYRGKDAIIKPLTKKEIAKLKLAEDIKKAEERGKAKKMRIEKDEQEINEEMKNGIGNGQDI